MANKFTNTIKDGEITGYNPDGTADYYLIGDHNRDHKYWQETISKAIRLLSTNPTLDCMILYGGVVSDSGSSQIDISAGAAVGKDTNGDVKIVEWPAQTNLVVPDDAGAQTWAVVKYESLLDSSTTRAHFNGETYHHVLEDSCDGVITPTNWFVTSDPNVVADSLVCLGSFTMTAGTYAEVIGERSDVFYPSLEDIFNNIIVGTSSLDANTTGTANVAIGYQSLNANTIGTNNVAIGYQSLNANTTGIQNIAIGTNCLITNTSGAGNIAIGYQSLNDNTTGTDNIAIGYQSLNNNTTGVNNVAFGYESLFTNTIGTNNVAFGYESLRYNTTGINNVAIGYQSLRTNTIGTNNVAIGYQSLDANTTGTSNVGIGYQSLGANTTGTNNVAIGYQSLNANTIGTNNVAIGYQSLDANTTGTNNVGIGYQSLDVNTIGVNNVGIGTSSLGANTTGTNNVAIGYQSLAVNTIGNSNVAVGSYSLDSNTTGVENTAIGHNSLSGNTIGIHNTAIGNRAGETMQTGSNNTFLGYNALPSSSSASNEVRVGNTSVSSIKGQVAFTTYSDQRDKTDIQDIPIGLDFIKKLKPRIFKWDMREWYAKKNEDNLPIRKNNKWQYEKKPDGSRKKENFTAGFIAQEIEALEENMGVQYLEIADKPDVPEGDFGVRQGNILPALVKAVQELSEQVEALKH